MNFPFKIIDLSHTLKTDIPAWDLDCGFHIKEILSYDECDTDVKFKIQSMSTPVGIGTHIDSPAHCLPGAASVSDLDIVRDHLLADCLVINVSQQVNEHLKIGLDDVLSFENLHGTIPKHSFVIFYTGWDQHWSTESYRNNMQFPSITAEVAEHIISRQVAGIGIDTLSPDLPGSNYPVHQIILGNGKYILENIANANQLPPTGSKVLILPMKILNATEAPVRAIGLLAN